MSDIEILAEKVAEVLGLSFDIRFEPEEDMRSGGWFFDVEDSSGKCYTVLITETPS
jgi:hypothetical protein